MKTALLLGNSDGIGLALTRRLLAEGWRVASLSRRPCPAAGLAAHVVCDAAAPDYGQRLRALVQQVAGEAPIDVCVHLIGTGNDFDPATMAGETELQRVDFLSLVTAMEVVVPAMVARGSGHFVGLSSLADELLVAECPGYPAAKAAITSYLTGTAKVLRRHGVAVTNVRFGFVDTKLAQARFRPRMVPVERAVDVLMRCLRRRPVQVSYPLSMAVLARLGRWLQRPSVWFGRS